MKKLIVNGVWMSDFALSAKKKRRKVPKNARRKFLSIGVLCSTGTLGVVVTHIPLFSVIIAIEEHSHKSMVVYYLPKVVVDSNANVKCNNEKNKSDEEANEKLQGFFQ